MSPRRALVAALLVAAGLLASAGPAAAAPSYGDQMAETNRHLNAYSMGHFLYNRSHESALGITYMIFESDQCSAPLAGNGPYNFVNPCYRHDFGYRNLKRVESTFGRDVWQWANKANVDTRFSSDLDIRCNEWNILVRPSCYATGNSYEYAVRTFALPVTVGINRYGLIW